MEPGASWPAASTYELRHPTLHGAPDDPGTSGELDGGDVGGQAFDEVVDSDAALRWLGSPCVHADGAIAHVVVTHHEQVGDLLELGGPDPLAQAVARVDEIDAVAEGPQAIDHPAGVGAVAVRHGEHANLQGCQPE